MSNYKTEAIADVLVSELAMRTGLPCSWKMVSSVPTVSVGENTNTMGGGATIQIKDQRNEVDAGWDALPGFPIANVQPVYTTGVGKVVCESLDDVSVAAAKATGVFTFGAGVAMGAGKKVTIAGIDLVEGVAFAAGVDDNASATNLAAAINVHPVLSQFLTAVATMAAASFVTITYKYNGAQGNSVTTTDDDAAAAWGGATMTGGAGASTSFVMPISLFQKIWACLAKRGLKMELYQTKKGVAPTAAATSYLQSEFNPNEYWPISGLA